LHLTNQKGHCVRWKLTQVGLGCRSIRFRLGGRLLSKALRKNEDERRCSFCRPSITVFECQQLLSEPGGKRVTSEIDVVNGKGEEGGERGKKGKNTRAEGVDVDRRLILPGEEGHVRKPKKVWEGDGHSGCQYL